MTLSRAHFKTNALEIFFCFTYSYLLFKIQLKKKRKIKIKNKLGLTTNSIIDYTKLLKDFIS